MRKFGITAGDDLENITRMVGGASSKLTDAVRAYLGN